MCWPCWWLRHGTRCDIGGECAIFEATTHGVPDIAGKNLANPTSVILASIQMLEYLEMHEQA